MNRRKIFLHEKTMKCDSQFSFPACDDKIPMVNSIPKSVWNKWLETTGTVSIKLAVAKESIKQCSACNDNHYTSNWKSKHVIWAISSDNMKVVSFNLIPWKVCCNQMEWLLFSNRYWCTWNIYFQFDHWLTILNWNRSQLFKASVS